MPLGLRLMGGILKILSCSEILPSYFVDRLYLSVAASGDKYCVFSGVQGAIEN